MVARRPLPLRTSSPARHRRRLSAFWKSLAVVLLCGGLFAAVVFVSRDPSLRIGEVEVTGAAVLSAEEIAGLVRPQLEGEYLFVIPKASTLFYPRGAIETRLLGAYPRLSSVEVGRKGLTALSIDVFERTPEYLWCGEKMDEKRDCYFLDASGYVFAKAPAFSGDILVRLYGPLAAEADDAAPAKTDTIGKYYLPASKFPAIRSMVRGVSLLSLTPSSLVRKEDGDYELLLKGGGKILFSDKEDPVRIVSNLDSALSSDPLKKNMAEKRSALQYIDLRFGNKVFFKFD